MMNLRPVLPFLLVLLVSACTQHNSLVDSPKTSTPQPSASPTQTHTPSPTPVLTTVDVTVWVEQPIVPVLTFHQFKPDGTPSDKSGHKMQLGEFRAFLEDLYASGYSLVHLEDWLAGNLSIPSGRRPLILTMDDLFYTNQLSMDETGVPDPESGLGVLWQFYQEHPDFGFAISLFAVMGDKYYPFDPQYHPNRDWEYEFAQILVWCIENGAGVYNHTYLHGYLNNVDHPVSIDGFIKQLMQNDARIRALLRLVDREDLIPKLANFIALPGGALPQNQNDWDELLQYTNPEGVPVQAILHIYSALTDPTTFDYLGSPYDPAFDPFQIPRIVGSPYYVQFIIDNFSQFPKAEACRLHLEESRRDDPDYLIQEISTAIGNGTCRNGYYSIDGHLFDARSQPILKIIIQ